MFFGGDFFSVIISFFSSTWRWFKSMVYEEDSVFSTFWVYFCLLQALFTIYWAKSIWVITSWIYSWMFCYKLFSFCLPKNFPCRRWLLDSESFSKISWAILFWSTCSISVYFCSSTCSGGSVSENKLEAAI